MAENTAHMVLYCLLCRQVTGDPATRFLLIRKQGQFTFPPTKLRQGEDLYRALVRPMEEDLGLPPGSYFLEQELAMIPSSGQSLRYPGLPKQWHLYPVTISLAKAAQDHLGRLELEHHWWTISEILQHCREPNVLAIAEHLQQHCPSLLGQVPSGPSMDALACQWAADHDAGVRIVRGEAIRQILSAGSRAFNLRVADPYLPYQKQGLGFTWSFFTPKDKQDVHVHGMPAVEIYGVMEGRLQLWHKPMNQRGVRTWRFQTLETGDWAEVEPLHCHFACWLSKEGLGVVIKAAAMGELAGVGRLGVAGKTTCTWKNPSGQEDHCSAFGQCQFPPTMQVLIEQYGKPYEQRDYATIAAAGKQTGIAEKAVVE